MSFLLIPLIFLYDEYIDRPKLSEQKNPFVYIVPPPTSGVGKNRVWVSLIERKFHISSPKNDPNNKKLHIAIE